MNQTKCRALDVGVCLGTKLQGAVKLHAHKHTPTLLTYGAPGRGLPVDSQALTSHTSPLHIKPPPYAGKPPEFSSSSPALFFSLQARVLKYTRYKNITPPSNHQIGGASLSPFPKYHLSRLKYKAIYMLIWEMRRCAIIKRAGGKP